MKVVLLRILALLLCTSAFAADDPIIPEGVHYKKVSDEVNDQARQKLLKVFSADATDKDVLAFFEPQVLICGPGLWQEIKGDDAVAPLGEGKVSFEVPILDDARKPTGRVNKMKGQLFQTDEEVLAFWKAFSKHAEFTDLKVRKLTTAELKIYWALISFDITEPVFVVEGKKHRILVQFTSPEKLRVAWIDDLANIIEKKKEEKK